MTEKETIVGLRPAGAAVAGAVIGGAFVGFAISAIIYVNKQRKTEAATNTPTDQQTPYAWYIWLFLILGILLILGAGGGLYYKKK